MKTITMKLQMETNGYKLLTNLVTALAGALLVVATTVSVYSTAHADDNTGRDDTEGDSGDSGDWSSDDETIGTLPSMGDPDKDGVLRELLSEAPPSFYIQGPAPELLRAILMAEAGTFAQDSSVSFEILPHRGPGLGDLRISFHGDVNLGFDSALLEVDGVECGLSLGMSFEAYGAALVYNDRVLSRNVLDAGSTLRLPLPELLELGVLEDVEILTSRGKGVRTHIEIDVVGGLVYLGQDLYPGTGR